MKEVAINVGGVFGNDTTQYRVEEISKDNRVTATILKADLMLKKSVGKTRHDFASLTEFARWCEREF